LKDKKGKMRRLTRRKSEEEEVGVERGSQHFPHQRSKNAEKRESADVRGEEFNRSRPLTPEGISPSVTTTAAREQGWVVGGRKLERDNDGSFQEGGSKERKDTRRF